MTTKEAFPILSIHANSLEAAGSFAEAQARYLDPDPATVTELDALVRQKNIGVVAHFYMDPELQGVLARLTWPNVHISDSLVMADKAVQMVEQGCSRVVVLGVDFMSENARAMLDKAGYVDAPVYRVAADPIGCSLAESAQTKAYEAYLDQASKTPKSLHVVYINTSLRTKAEAHAKVPTITVTSSNVVQTILSAFAEIEDVEVFFGPDTYMGTNLARLLKTLTTLGDEAVQKLHPKHTVESIRALLPRFHYFEHGNCVVHHMFGKDVADRIRSEHQDAFITAHLEVPGEMFELALEAQSMGRGVVGSTSDILGFIEKQIRSACSRPDAATLSFVLGTETGMVTSIVSAVQKILGDVKRDDIACEVIFPVASEALTRTEEALPAMGMLASKTKLIVIPGAQSGEGCSLEGGCATCPYMKMNSLDALFAMLRELDVSSEKVIARFHPHHYVEPVIDSHGVSRSIADLGGEPILHMRGFQKMKAIPMDLREDVLTRASASS
jgi:quinolinate synthase